MTAAEVEVELRRLADTAVDIKNKAQASQTLWFQGGKLVAFIHAADLVREHLVETQDV